MFLLPLHPLPYRFEWESTQIKRLKNEEINVDKNTPKLFCTHLHTGRSTSQHTCLTRPHTQSSQPSHTIMSSRTPRISMQHPTHVTHVTTPCCHVILNTATLTWHIHGIWLIYPLTKFVIGYKRVYKIKTHSNCYLSCMRNILWANGSHPNMGLIIRRLLLLLLISPLYAYLL